jgi:hypothetical protein
MTPSKCLYDPTKTQGAIGMHHCPVCGDMQIAGFEHTGVWDEGDWADFQTKIELMQLDKDIE